MYNLSSLTNPSPDDERDIRMFVDEEGDIDNESDVELDGNNELDLELALQRNFSDSQLFQNRPLA